MEQNPDWFNWRVLATDVGFGFLIGWAVGFTMKKVTKVLAIVVGILFILIQVLVYYKLAMIDWHGISHIFTQVASSLEGKKGDYWQILIGGLPWAASFGVGFFVGFRKG